MGPARLSVEARLGPTCEALQKKGFERRDRKISAVRDDVLWKGGGDSKEKRWHVQAGVFPGQSATN